MKGFLPNSVTIPVQSERIEAFYLDSVIEFEEVENEQEYPNFSISPAILDELENQQSQRFFDFRQFRVPSKIQTAFTAGVKIHRRNLPPKPVNYQQLKDYPFEKQFCINMEEHMHQHNQQFKSWSAVSSKKAVRQQVLGCQ